MCSNKVKSSSNPKSHKIKPQTRLSPVNTMSKDNISCNIASTKPSFHTWHCRLGHTYDNITKSIVQLCNDKPFNKKTDCVCSSSCLGKLHTFHFLHSQRVHSKPLEFIQTDVQGPSPTLFTNGYKYYVNFTDSYSRYTQLYLLKTKDQTLTSFKHFNSQVELQLGHKIKTIQIDGGGEFRAFTRFLAKSGITHHISCSHVHEQNGLAERKHRQITETTLTLLAHASLPFRLWDEAVRTAVFIINRLPSKAINNKVPIFVLFNKPPSYDSLKRLVAFVFLIQDHTTNVNLATSLSHAL